MNVKLTSPLVLANTTNEFYDCQFNSNTAQLNGGVISFDNANMSVSFIESTFDSNDAINGKGGCFHMVNCNN